MLISLLDLTKSHTNLIQYVKKPIKNSKVVGENKKNKKYSLKIKTIKK